MRKFQKIFYCLSNSNKPHRNAKFLANAEQNSAFSGSIQFCDDESRNSGKFHELARLAQTVLAGGRVKQFQQRRAAKAQRYLGFVVEVDHHHVGGRGADPAETAPAGVVPPGTAPWSLGEAS